MMKKRGLYFCKPSFFRIIGNSFEFPVIQKYSGRMQIITKIYEE